MNGFVLLKKTFILITTFFSGRNISNVKFEVFRFNFTVYLLPKENHSSSQFPKNTNKTTI